MACQGHIVPLEQRWVLRLQLRPQALVQDRYVLRVFVTFFFHLSFFCVCMLGHIPSRRTNNLSIDSKDKSISSDSFLSTQTHSLSQVYSFVPIPGAQQHKRPRRRYEEIERMYKCGWNGCEKAYGTLNHLNAHVTMQSHGAKRTPEGLSCFSYYLFLRKTRHLLFRSRYSVFSLRLLLCLGRKMLEVVSFALALN